MFTAVKEIFHYAKNTIKVAMIGATNMQEFTNNLLLGIDELRKKTNTLKKEIKELKEKNKHI